jgi:uncharacterized membrane protein YfcA
LDLINTFLLLAIGLIIATPASMVGLGGGILIVPVLIVLGVPAQNAVAISLVAMCGTTISASVGYIRHGRVDYKLSLLYDILDIPGVAVGAYMTSILPKNVLAGICGIFVMAMSVLLMRNKMRTLSVQSELSNKQGWKTKKVDSSNQTFEYAIRKPSLALASSFLSGFVGGLAGLGGGITDTTTMILLGVPPHIAVASSEFAMALTNGAGVVAHGLLQNILWDYAIPLTVGTFVGAQIGVLACRRVKAQTLTKILVIIAFFMGIRLVLLLFNV